MPTNSRGTTDAVVNIPGRMDIFRYTASPPGANRVGAVGLKQFYLEAAENFRLRHSKGATLAPLYRYHRYQKVLELIWGMRL
jgi:hypothetical protein